VAIAVLDIETVASDRIVEYERLFGKKTPNKKLNKPGLHWLTGRVFCICIKPLGKPVMTFCDEDENAILSAFYEYLLTLKPVNLVTFNGHSFDIPFLYMRGLVHGLDFSSLLPRDKWSRLHMDLYEHLGGKWGLNAKLAEICWMLGIDRIYGTGGEVQDLYDNKDFQKIIEHCTGDVEAVEQLYNRLFPHGRVEQIVSR
jgi:hypothetical protein